MWSDLKFTFRAIRRQPGFALMVLLTLSLGIGGSVAIFTVVNAVLLRDLPYPDAKQIYLVRTMTPDGAPTGNITPRDVASFVQNEQHPLVQAAAIAWSQQVNIVGADGKPYSTTRYGVTDQFFEVFGSRMALGRAFERGQNPGPLVISYATWRDLFGLDPDIIGKSVNAEGFPREVVGVTREDFEFPEKPGFWYLMRLGASYENVRSYRALHPAAGGPDAQSIPGRADRARQGAAGGSGHEASPDLRGPALPRPCRRRPGANRHASVWRDRHPPAHCLHQRRQPSVVPGHHPSQGDGRSRSARCQSMARRSPAADGKRRAGAHRRHDRAGHRRGGHPGAAPDCTARSSTIGFRSVRREGGALLDRGHGTHRHPRRACSRGTSRASFPAFVDERRRTRRGIRTRREEVVRGTRRCRDRAGRPADDRRGTADAKLCESHDGQSRIQSRSAADVFHVRSGPRRGDGRQECRGPSGNAGVVFPDGELLSRTGGAHQGSERRGGRGHDDKSAAEQDTVPTALCRFTYKGGRVGMPKRRPCSPEAEA